MSEYNVNIVIGANFGDEGKGYVSNALSANKKTLTILPTGGSQRAHTVDCNNKYCCLCTNREKTANRISC